MTTRILGTASGLTGIPSLLPSTLHKITDRPTHDAIYQIQNWANSFPIFNFGNFNGAYVTGGVTVPWKNPYTDPPPMVLATALGIPARVITVNTNAIDHGLFQAWVLSTGAEVANGTSLIFFYQAIGH